MLICTYLKRVEENRTTAILSMHLSAIHLCNIYSETIHSAYSLLYHKLFITCLGYQLFLFVNSVEMFWFETC